MEVASRGVTDAHKIIRPGHNLKYNLVKPYCPSRSCPNLSLEVSCFQVSRCHIARYLLLQLTPQPIHQLLNLCSCFLRFAGPPADHPSGLDCVNFWRKPFRGYFGGWMPGVISEPILELQQLYGPGWLQSVMGARELSQVWCGRPSKPRSVKRGCETQQLSNFWRQIYQQVQNII